MSKTSQMLNKVDLVSLMSVGRKKKKGPSPYPRFNRRMLAGTIDGLLLAVLAPFFDWVAPLHSEALSAIKIDPNDPNAYGFIMQILTNREFMASWLFNLFTQAIVFCVFSAICWHFWANTPGKMLMRIKVVDAITLNSISDRQILLRCAGYLLSCFSFMLGFLWINFDKKKRAWHDLIAGTVVVTIPWKKEASPS
jgi:uncharacterized RDD family membrane protein YckC